MPNGPQAPPLQSADDVPGPPLAGPRPGPAPNQQGRRGCGALKVGALHVDADFADRAPGRKCQCHLVALFVIDDLTDSDLNWSSGLPRQCSCRPELSSAWHDMTDLSRTAMLVPARAVVWGSACRKLLAAAARVKFGRTGAARRGGASGFQVRPAGRPLQRRISERLAARDAWSGGWSRGSRRIASGRNRPRRGRIPH